MFYKLNAFCRIASCRNQPLSNIKHFSSSSARRQTHYDTLGVNKQASKNKIKFTYFELSKKFHPDLSTDPDAKDKFTRITRAYAVLSNEESRKTYDKQLVEEQEAAVRRRLEEVRNLFLARRQEREKSEAGKAHPTTKTAINVGRWAYVMQEKRMKGDYTWENPRRYKEGRQTTAQQAKPAASSSHPSPGSSRQSQTSQRKSEDADTEERDRNGQLRAIMTLIESTLVAGCCIYALSITIADMREGLHSFLEKLKKKFDSVEQD